MFGHLGISKLPKWNHKYLPEYEPVTRYFGFESNRKAIDLMWYDSEISVFKTKEEAFEKALGFLDRMIGDK